MNRAESIQNFTSGLFEQAKKAYDMAYYVAPTREVQLLYSPMSGEFHIEIENIGENANIDYTMIALLTRWDLREIAGVDYDATADSWYTEDCAHLTAEDIDMIRKDHVGKLAHNIDTPETRKKIIEDINGAWDVWG